MAPKIIKSVPALLWSAIVLYLCLTDISGLPTVGIDDFDKLSHFTFHFIFTALWFFAFAEWKPEKSKGSHLINAALLSFSYGVIIEFLQHYCTVGRQGDWRDVVGNSFGTIAFILCYNILRRLKQRKQTAS
ncbi:VanZ family protein [Flavobacterium sp.]|uniref:VanZ family protein n=1 Tax=Flavobacterium sp. TaxID=239 RepID=UPI00262EAEDA|nr:VanZ family protein [Flavobacterium sp.]